MTRQTPLAPFAVAGRHHAKINALHQLSAETIPYMDELAKLNRHVLGPGKIALSAWEKAGLALPDASVMRHNRLARVRQKVGEHNCMVKGSSWKIKLCLLGNYPYEEELLA